MRLGGYLSMRYLHYIGGERDDRRIEVGGIGDLEGWWI